MIPKFRHDSLESLIKANDYRDNIYCSRALIHSNNKFKFRFCCCCLFVLWMMKGKIATDQLQYTVTGLPYIQQQLVKSTHHVKYTSNSSSSNNKRKSEIYCESKLMNNVKKRQCDRTSTLFCATLS